MSHAGKYRFSTLILLFSFAIITAGCGGTRQIGGDVLTDLSEFDHLESDLDYLEPEVPVEDTDLDCIPDSYEGKEQSVDTDGDTTPDFEDEDSDNDTIPDSIEAGRTSCQGQPVDSDGDTTPDFRDTDSDGNGIDDSIEGSNDTDGDGQGDYADKDNDGDNLDDTVEIGGDPDHPIDSDHDSTPDYLDTDSDNDTIMDIHEQFGGADMDTDGDTTPDRLDDDSDGDGWSDAEEAGDDDPATPPVNTDGDDYPDFRDFDSDADGLSDKLEKENGTQRLNPDSDSDGVSDLIEVGYGSDPNDPDDNPRVHGDFVFVVPYNNPENPPAPPLEPEPSQDTLVFSTDIQQADVFFAIDTTGSMGGEIENLRDSLSSLIIPQIRDTIPDVWFGVGGFDDYPVEGYGTTGDRVFYLEQRMTSDAGVAQSAVENLTTHDGRDIPESQVSVLKVIADGSGLNGYLDPQTECNPDEIGYPCFRTGSVPIIILITDAPFHNGPDGDYPYEPALLGFTPPAYSDSIDALNSIHAKVIGVNSGTTSAAVHLHRAAVDTGTVDISGNALVFQISSTGAGLGTNVVRAVQQLASLVPIDISTSTADDPDDFRCIDSDNQPVSCCRDSEGNLIPCSGDSTVSVDAIAAFIDRIVPNLIGGVEDPEHPGVICRGGLSVDDPSDPHYFVDILPGEAVCFDIYPKRNTTVPAVEEPQLFRAFINVIGDMVTTLDTRDVYFLVPPVIEEPILE